MEKRRDVGWWDGVWDMRIDGILILIWTGEGVGFGENYIERGVSGII